MATHRSDGSRSVASSSSSTGSERSEAYQPERETMSSNEAEVATPPTTDSTTVTTNTVVAERPSQTAAAAAMSSVDPAHVERTTSSSGTLQVKSESKPKTKKTRKSDSSPSSSTPNYSWTPSEDAQLQEAVKQKGDNAWAEVGLLVGRNPGQCQQRWKNYLMPGLKKGVWDFREDELLRKHTTAELRLCGRLGKRVNWTNVALHIPNRTAKQCRERWVNHLDPDVKKISWTLKEDQLLLKLEAQHPNKWAKIARHMEGRTENMVKVRFKTLTRNPAKIGKMPNLRTRSPNGTRKDYAAARKQARLSQQQPNKGATNNPTATDAEAALRELRTASKGSPKRLHDGTGQNGTLQKRHTSGGASASDSTDQQQQQMLLPGAVSFLQAMGTSSNMMPYHHFPGAVGSPLAAGNANVPPGGYPPQAYFQLLAQQYAGQRPGQMPDISQQMRNMPHQQYGQQQSQQQRSSPTSASGNVHQGSPNQQLFNHSGYQPQHANSNMQNRANQRSPIANSAPSAMPQQAGELHPLVMYLLQLAHLVNEATTMPNKTPAPINTQGIYGYVQPSSPSNNQGMNTANGGMESMSQRQPPQQQSLPSSNGMPVPPVGINGVIPPHILQEVASILQSKMGAQQQQQQQQGNSYDKVQQQLHPAVLAQVVQQAQQLLPPQDQQHYAKNGNDAITASWMLQAMNNSQRNQAMNNTAASTVRNSN